jgi:hypothetical protein
LLPKAQGQIRDRPERRRPPLSLVGNAGAHFDELQPVEQAEASALARLCRHLITMVYETPAGIRRARQLQPSL